MQLIILAAGIGRRLRHATTDKPKCMVEVNGKTLIERSLDNIDKERFSRIILVVGYRKENIYSLLGDSHNGVPITYVENPVYDKTNNIYSLYLARNLLVEDDTILMESDLIYEKKILDDLLANRHPNVVVVDKYKSHMDGTVVKIADNQEVTAFISKRHFDYREVDSYYKTVNIYKFSREFSQNTYVPFLELYCKVQGLNKYYEQVLRVILTLDQQNLKAQTVKGENWYEIDTIPDLRNAELLFADIPMKKLHLYQERYGGYWRNEALLDFCYLVNPFFPTHRIVEEIKSEFALLMGNYPSGQSTQSLLAAELFACREEHLIVGNGAAELLPPLLAATPGRIGVPVPTFNEYLSRVEKKRLVKIRSTNRELAYTLKDLLGSLDAVDSLVLINPDNPSGNFITKEDMLELVRECGRRGKRLLVDESFVDFAGKLAYTLISSELLEEFPQLTVIKSISKSYGVPGLRLGVVATANGQLRKELLRATPIWNINSFAEFFLQIASKYQGIFTASCRKLSAVRQRLRDKLKEIPGLTPFPGQGNFILCRLDDGRKSADLAAELLFNHNILVKDCAGKEGMGDEQYLRFSVRSEKDNEALVNALKLLHSIKYS